MTASAGPGRSRDGFQHLLAFGNSDQASFRNQRVRESFDVMTVPGTIASYYEEATAAFVLSSQVSYMIDPRTPLFQDDLLGPRASHFTLAAWHGPRVLERLQHGAEAGVSRFPVDFWTSEVVGEMAREVVGRQRAYAENAPRVTKKLDRYARILAAALAEQQVPHQQRDPAAPAAVLAPYFAVRGVDDDWWSVLLRIWDACAELDAPGEIRPVICVDGRQDRAALQAVLQRLPDKLADTAYFWITNFDERAASETELRDIRRIIAATSETKRLINLYGGFFSICMRYVGLAGFGNGLTYSESRAWPALASTGSAPPRYYVRDLHAFMSPAAAAGLVAADRSFACPCPVCVSLPERGLTIASMPYHELKLHFALAREWELQLTAASTQVEVAQVLRDAQRRADAVRSSVVRPPSSHLDSWASVLERP